MSAFYGDNADNVLEIFNANDVLFGLGGNHTLFAGGATNQYLDGASGNDWLVGYIAAEQALDGGAGDDTLVAVSGQRPSTIPQRRL